MKKSKLDENLEFRRKFWHLMKPRNMAKNSKFYITIKIGKKVKITENPNKAQIIKNVLKII